MAFVAGAAAAVVGVRTLGLGVGGDFGEGVCHHGNQEVHQDDNRQNEERKPATKRKLSIAQHGQGNFRSVILEHRRKRNHRFVFRIPP